MSNTVDAEEVKTVNETSTDLSVPKAEAVTSAEVTKVNTSVASSVKEKDEQVNEPDPNSALLTGRKLALAHLGFLLYVSPCDSSFMS
jgi:hypothetical protein